MNQYAMWYHMYIRSSMNHSPAVIAFCALVLAAAGAGAQDRGIQRLGTELLTAKDRAVRRKAAEGLGRAGSDQAVALLDRGLAADASVEVRLEIVRALREIAFQRNPGFRRALTALSGATEDAAQRDELVRLRATEALWEAGKKDLLDPVPTLERRLTDPSQRLRLAAVLMLRKHGSPEAAEALGRAVVDTGLSETIRLAAIDALGAVAQSAPGIVGREVAAANIAASGHTGQTPFPSAGALELRHERQVAYLAAVAGDPTSSETLVLSAVKSIGRVKDASSVPILRQLIETHRSPAVRKQATRVLSHVLARQYE